MNLRDERAELQALLARAEAQIGTVEVPADLLKDFLKRLDNAEAIYSRQMACLRETEEARDIQRAPGGFSCLYQIERTARSYMGAEFHNLEASCMILKRLCAAVRDGDHKTARYYVGTFDAGMDDRPWESEEEKKAREEKKREAREKKIKKPRSKKSKTEPKA